jgi:hypothetical protein
VTKFAAVCVGLALVTLVGCKKTGEGAKVDPALSTLVPSDTTMLIGVRVEDFVKTPIYKKYLADKALRFVDDFTAEFDIDPRKDLWEVLFISNGAQQVILARGKFSNEAEPRVLREARGAKRFGYHGVTFVGDDRSAVMLMGPSMVGVGDTAALKRVIDARDQTNGPPKVLADRMKDVPREAALWSVYAGPPISLPPNATANMGNAIKILNSIESGSAWLDLRTAVTAKAIGSTASDAKGKELFDALRGLLGLARLMGAKDNVQLQGLLDGVRVTQDARNVNVYLDQPETAITSLFDMLTTTQGRLPAPAR